MHVFYYNHMTVIFGIQGEGCALLASDLKGYVTYPDQLHLPLEEREYTKCIISKIRKNIWGDYTACAGMINENENAAVNQRTLEQFLVMPLIHDPRMRPDNHFAIFYLSKQGQLYKGLSDTPLEALSFGNPDIAFNLSEHEVQSFITKISDILNSRLAKVSKLDITSLQELSRYLRAAFNTEQIQGYECYISDGHKIKRVQRSLGNLKGLYEVDSDFFLR